MNKSRRVRIDRIIEMIDELMSDVYVLYEEENDAYENLPDSLKDSERGEAMYDAVSNLEDAYGSLEEANDYLECAKGEY